MRGCSVLSIRHCVANGRDMELRARTSMGGHEYRVFETVKLPGGQDSRSGGGRHCTDLVDHPELVAERLVNVANLVGMETSMPARIAASDRASGMKRSFGPS